MQSRGRGSVGDLDERDDGERKQHDELKTDQHVLKSFARGDPAHRHPRGYREQYQRRQDVHELVGAEICDRRLVEDLGDDQVEELHADRREIRQHDDGRHDHAPTAHPAHVRPKCLGRPGERRSAVGGVLVEFPVGVRGQEHRDETGDEDRGHLEPDRRDDQSDTRGERVTGGHRRNPEDSTGEHSDLARREPLAVRFDGDRVRRGRVGRARRRRRGVRRFGWRRWGRTHLCRSPVSGAAGDDDHGNGEHPQHLCRG